MNRSCSRGVNRVMAAIAAALSILAIAAPLKAADADWRVGLAAAKITPEEPIWMAGYASRDKPSEGVLADLHGKAMAVEDSAGHRAVLITVDVIGFRDCVAALVCDKVAEKTGLERQQIMLCPSHTHTGPVLGLPGGTSYSMPEAEATRVHQYTEQLAGKLADLAAAAIADMQPARLAWGTGVIHFVMNRREFTDRGVRLGFNPRGYVDRSVPVLRVAAADGTPRAVLFGCACHNTTLTGHHYVLSGDYAGFAQAAIEEQMPDVQAMFMIGCGGDANPYPRGEIDHAKDHGRELAAEVCRVAGGKLEPIHGPLATVLGNADAPLQPPASREELEAAAKGRGYTASNAQQILKSIAENKPLPTTYPVPIAVWQFGHDLTLVAIAGEVTAGYVPLVEKVLGPRRLWIAGYANEVYGYLVTARDLCEGGYETRGLYTSVGYFSPQAQDVVVAKVRELAEKAGRKVPE